MYVDNVNSMSLFTGILDHIVYSRYCIDFGMYCSSFEDINKCWNVFSFSLDIEQIFWKEKEHN